MKDTAKNKHAFAGKEFLQYYPGILCDIRCLFLSGEYESRPKIESLP